MEEYILCAAIKLNIRENEPPVVIGGYRHSDCMTAAITMGYNSYITQNEQGFLTSKGRFVDRKAAKNIAVKAKQLLYATGADMLRSEDIY